MKRLVAVLAVVSSVAFAQEIGTEISSPPPGTDTAQPTTPAPAPMVPVVEPGPVSAGKGAFGIRASFSGGTFSIPSTASTAGAGSSVGIAFFASDSFKLLIDLGATLALVNSDVAYGFNALVGFDLMFRHVTDALRPFFHAGAFFNLNGGASNVVPSFGVQLGFGAEYFLSHNFSLNGRLLLAVPMATVNGDFTLLITTVSPGVGATWYF